MVAGSYAFAQCESVTDPAAGLLESGAARIQWSYFPCVPTVARDTIHHHTAGVADEFFVQGSEDEEVVAVPLTTLPPGTQIRSVRAYVFGSGGASLQQWRLEAGMWCSVHWDSNGYPGSPIEVTHYWPLGDDDALFHGGWYVDSSGWALDLTDTMTLWLAIHWLPGTAEIIRLGRDSLNAPHAFVAGVGTNPVWQRLYWPGLLVEVVVEYPPTVPAEILSRRVIVTRQEWVEGGDSTLVVLDTVPVCDGGFIDNRQPDASEIRYSLVSLCDTMFGAPVWTGVMQTPATVAAVVWPQYLSMAIPEGEHATLAFEVRSSDPDTLHVSVSQVDTLSWVNGPSLTLKPAMVDLPPHDVQVCSVGVDASGAAPGFHSTVLHIDLVDSRSGDTLAVDVLVELIVDQRTAVSDVGEESPPRDWEIYPLQNPFSDYLGVRMTAPVPLTDGGGLSSIDATGADVVELAVYDILGRLLTTVTEPLDDRLTTGGGGKTIRIDGTTSWASGVYIGRVRVGRITRSVKLIHLK
ncbi:MAG: hypothetical protein Kow0074_19970 [Candidatus Zixiibacteriota bacterium]